MESLHSSLHAVCVCEKVDVPLTAVENAFGVCGVCGSFIVHGEILRDGGESATYALSTYFIRIPFLVLFKSITTLSTMSIWYFTFRDNAVRFIRHLLILNLLCSNLYTCSYLNM